MKEWLSRRLSPGDRYALAVVLATKVCVLLVGAIAFVAFQNQYPDGAAGPWRYLNIWRHWDANTYVELAENGYTKTEPTYLAFFPLYPFLVSLVRRAGLHDTVQAAFAVSTVASLFTVVQFYRLARLDLGPPAAKRAVWFLVAFPTAYFLHIGFTEGLFLALAFAAMRSARTGKWAAAGILGALAAATRMQGALLIPFFAVVAIRDWRVASRFPVRSLLGLLTLLGTGVYLYLNWRTVGDPLAFLRYQRENWNHNFVPPWTGIWDSTQYGYWAEPADGLMVGYAEAVAAVIGFAAAAYAFWRREWAYAAWTLLNVVLWTSNDFMMSGPCYLLALVPLFLLLGRFTVRRGAWAAVTAVCLLLQGLFVALFANGRWAF